VRRDKLLLYYGEVRACLKSLDSARNMLLHKNNRLKKFVKFRE